ncbi:MAG TPA: glycosyltransferase family 4 protein [Candidatus Treponema faecavium]|nr:glycosyltransferase family 4 protein [Candidatus Treponema faecavium]
MKHIAVYIWDILYRFGGTESYTANLLYALQELYPDADITVITELHPGTYKPSTEAFVHRLNTAYGIHIRTNHISLSFFRSPSYKNKLQYLRFVYTLKQRTKPFDLFIYCSRGLYSGRAKKNIAIVHFPTEPKMVQSFSRRYPILKRFAQKTDREYLTSYCCFLPNSQFTAAWLTTMWHIDNNKITVLYPPVTPISIAKKPKTNTILICSRIEQSKKIEVLIKAYLSSPFLTQQYKLIIAGAAYTETQTYAAQLQRIAEHIRFFFNPDRQTLEQLYANATFFWHAKGFGIDENSSPYELEHFGITTVEAMSAGCIPIVINKGGQKEIVDDTCGRRWNTIEELVSYTEQIARNQELLQTLSQQAVQKSRNFSYENFKQRLQCILDSKL